MLPFNYPFLQMCVSRLSSRESADSHYKAVCRALIAETLELSTFLDQIAKGTKVSCLILTCLYSQSNKCFSFLSLGITKVIFCCHWIFKQFWERVRSNLGEAAVS